MLPTFRVLNRFVDSALSFPPMKTSRRRFLTTTALGATAAPLLSSALVAATSAKEAPARTTSSGTAGPSASSARVYLRQKHRNLFNGDSCVFFYNPEIFQSDDFTLKTNQGKTGKQTIAVGGPFSAKAIRNYVDTLAKNGVDTFLINANASKAWYPSKKIPSILDGYRRGDREFFRGHAICAGVTDPAEMEGFLDRFEAFFGLYQDLLDAKVDWLAEAAKACHARGISPWVSIRMNDFHGAKNIEGSFFNHPLLKIPEMRLKKGAYSPTMRDPGYRTPLNFEKKEVRDSTMRQIEEVVNDYDFAGLEMDWWRNPNCCEPNATPATVATMTDWFREIRALTQARAKKTGRPYPVGMRIPGRLDTVKSIGIDVETLCREGIVDFLCPSGFWCTSWEMPHDDLRRRLGENVAIYGVIEDGANSLGARSPEHNLTQRLRYISCSAEILRANAAGKLVLGAEGLEWFNFYCTDQARLPGLTSDYSLLRGMNTLEAVRGLPKHYSFSMWANFFTQIPFELPSQLPAVLDAGWLHPFRLPMCAEPADRNLELVLQVVLKAEDTFTALPVSINGCWPKLEYTKTDRLVFPCGSLSHHVPENVGYDFLFPISAVRDGWNEIVVENGGAKPITVVCIELAVRPIGA